MVILSYAIGVLIIACMFALWVKFKMVTQHIPLKEAILDAIGFVLAFALIQAIMNIYF